MSGEVTRNRDGGTKQHRPSWIYGPNQGDSPAQQLEMLESIRNVLESIHRSQMLQCDVAGAIKRTEVEARQTRLILARIDRRLAKAEKLK